MNRKIISIFAIFTLILVIQTANAQLSLGGEAKQDLIEIKLNPEGEINVKHIVRSSNVGSTLLIFDNAIIPDQNFTGENELGEEIQLGIIDDGLGNKSIFILPSKYNAIIEYSLEDMILKDNLFTTTISYHEKFDVIFDESIEMLFVNNNSIFLDDKKGIAVSGGGDAKIEFYSNPSKILKEIIWDENKFDLEIIGDAKIERFNFDQASKSISFEITDKSKFVSIKLSEELLGGPYLTLLNDEKIKHTKYVNNKNIILLNIMPESKGTITIIGTTVIPEFSMFLPFILGFLIILTVPFMKKINLH
ncbi:MAG: hypothetical protein HN500_01240 [Nitrosopumilus sp.]|nr:hypothetical protein [Nitrosopumilus sp.]